MAHLPRTHIRHGEALAGILCPLENPIPLMVSVDVKLRPGWLWSSCAIVNCHLVT